MSVSRPYKYHNQATKLDLTSLGNQIAESEELKQSIYDKSRQISIGIVQARAVLEKNENNEEGGITTSSDADLESLFFSLVSTTADRNVRQGNLSHRVEDYVSYKAFIYFLNNDGRLLPPSECKYATDEEYLAGACMSLPSDLSRYGMGRATARDEASVDCARNLVNDIMDQLLQFDFRNGPLRRKYDGTKYSLKALETLLYELSVTSSNNNDGEPKRKRSRAGSGGVDDKDLLIPKAELEELRLRMEHRDELREKLIKKCRDGQKAAKQSIFALHRGDRKKASQLLRQCEDCINNELIPIVTEEPGLRYGSFSNVLEEYAEGQLFFSWLYGKSSDDNIMTSGSPNGVLLGPTDFKIELEPEEYLGGLCDLTGEIGRFAVKKGTERDTDSVRLCLQTNWCITTALKTMKRVPGGINKKMNTIDRSVEKIERMLYEMSLTEATGRTVSSDTPMAPQQEDD